MGLVCLCASIVSVALGIGKCCVGIPSLLVLVPWTEWIISTDVEIDARCDLSLRCDAGTIRTRLLLRWAQVRATLQRLGTAIVGWLSPQQLQNADIAVCVCVCTRAPACVINGSQYWAVDRDTFPHSEERLDMALLPPKSLDEWRAALMGWNGFALSMHSAAPLDPATGRPASGEVGAAQRDLRIADGLQMLGDPINAVDKKLTVSVNCLFTTSFVNTY